MIYGDVEKLEKYEEETVARINKERNMHNAFSESRKRGVHQQNMQKKQRRVGAGGESGGGGNAQRHGGVSASSIAGLKESALIDFVLRRHPQESVVDRLKREYIRTSQDMTVENLKVFLGKKLSYFPHHHFQVSKNMCLVLQVL